MEESLSPELPRSYLILFLSQTAAISDLLHTTLFSSPLYRCSGLTCSLTRRTTQTKSRAATRRTAGCAAVASRHFDPSPPSALPSSPFLSPTHCYYHSTKWQLVASERGMESSSADPPRPEDVALVEAADPAVRELTTTHLARFEFSDAGTKILMVEWVPQAVGSAQDGSGVKDKDAPWEVSWPGKQTFLPASDSDHQLSPTASGQPSSPTSSTRRRIFFLLPPTSSVPAEITLTPPGQDPINLKPLPAIFPEGFFLEEAAGPRGVLHTIWAKKRLRELQKEIEDELRNNAEGVAVEMAIAEKQWITDNFLPRPAEEQQLRNMGSAGMTPISPRSPIGGRLGEKLKGLRLGTSPADLIPGVKGRSTPFLDSRSQTADRTATSQYVYELCQSVPDPVSHGRRRRRVIIFVHPTI